MKKTAGLNFLGIGAAFNPAMDNTSAWFTKNGIFYLLDCGESVFGKIWNLPEFNEAEAIAVTLTHMHCDHVGSLGTLLSYCFIVLEKPVHIFYPSDAINSHLALVGIDRSFYSHSLESPDHWDVHFTPYPVKHASDMECYGYVFEYEGQTIYYSGDSSEVPPPVLELLLNDSIDALFQDTTIEENDHHCTLRVLEKAIPQALRHKVFAMHLPNEQSIEQITSKGFKVVER